MPVSQVTQHPTEVLLNHVYVIAPGTLLKVEDRYLFIDEANAGHTTLGAIDYFFHSLALSHRQLAIGVLLSGMGNDGCGGLAALREQGGTRLMANFETTPPVRTNCMQQSKRTLPVRRWACVEWHMAVATNEMRFWIDGKDITHVKGRAAAADACQGDDLGGEWKAPPRFDSFYLGFERYGDTTNDQNLWIDDVALGEGRIGCPARK